MKYMYIPTGIKRKLVRFGVDCNQKGHIVQIYYTIIKQFHLLQTDPYEEF